MAQKSREVVTLDIQNALNSDSAAFLIQLIESLICHISQGLFMTILFTTICETDVNLRNYNTGIQNLGLYCVMWCMVECFILPYVVREIGFADNISVIVVTKHRPRVLQICKQMVKTRVNWMLSAQLTSEVELISSRKGRETITLKIGRCQVSQPSIHYLPSHIQVLPSGCGWKGNLSMYCPLDNNAEHRQDQVKHLSWLWWISSVQYELHIPSQLCLTRLYVSL